MPFADLFKHKPVRCQAQVEKRAFKRIWRAEQCNRVAGVDGLCWQHRKLGTRKTYGEGVPHASHSDV